jgi:hypothetical protein
MSSQRAQAIQDMAPRIPKTRGHGTNHGVDSDRMVGHNPPMAQASRPQSVKMICGMIASRSPVAPGFDEATGPLEQAFGPIDIASEVMPFDFTHYYDGQMGSPLLRQFVSFERLAPADSLASAKLFTNELERQFAAAVEPGAPPRPINLDPGYLEEHKLVLASMKNFSHRIYIGGGVFAEVTLTHRAADWEKLPWTFPDFASGRYFGFLSAARNLLPGVLEGKP